MREIALGFEIPDERVRKRLERQPLDDLRIDFEDGYGVRSDEEEDEHARQVARELAAAVELPPRYGIRLKSWGPRAARTLRLVAECGRPLVVTLPKAESRQEIEGLLAELDSLGLQWEIELMVESAVGLRGIREWARLGRCRAVHFGPYDFLASCGVLHGDLHHPLCVQAKLQMLMELSDTGVWCTDGPTTRLPLKEDIQAAWATHREDIRRSWELGYTHSWDLHPAQLVSRWSEVFAQFDRLLPVALERLRNWMAARGRPTAVGGEFDDRATARVWFNQVVRALASGVVTHDELGLPWFSLVEQLAPQHRNRAAS